jgi:hypothetical protein
MRLASAFVAALWLMACSPTGGDPTSGDARADGSAGSTEVQTDQGLPVALPDANRAEGPDANAADAVADGTADAKDAALDLPPLGADASAETEGWLCPGHREPCFAGNCNARFSIETADGSASITSVRALAGGCTIDEIASPVGTEVKVVDGGFPAAVAVVVIIGSVCLPTAACSFEVSFINGASTVVTTNYSQSVAITLAFCIDNADCCPPSRYVETVSSPCVLWPVDFAVDVPSGADGGAAAIDGAANRDGNLVGG